MSESTERLRKLYRHAEWADERVLEAMRRSEDPRALEILAHLLASEVVWFARIETGQSAHLKIWPTMSLDECVTLARENSRAYRTLVDGLSESDLTRAVTYRNSKGNRFDTPLGDILLHVAMHGSYHRGQIALRLRESDGEPVNTDYITWVREEATPSSG